MVAPLALIGLALGKKKKRGKWDSFIAVLVVCVVVGMSVSACNQPSGASAPTTSGAPTPLPTSTATPKVTLIVPTSLTPTLASTNETAVQVKTSISDDGCNNLNASTLEPEPTLTPMPSSIKDELMMYGVELTGKDAYWTLYRQDVILSAVKAIANRFGGILGLSPIEAFTRVFPNHTFEWCDKCVDNGYGWCFEENKIKLDGMYTIEYKAVRLIVHEMGHAMDQKVCASRRADGACETVFENSARTDLQDVWNNDYCGEHLCLARNGHNGPETGVYWGFAGGCEEWQFGMTDGPGEVWADMFIGWVFDTWDNDSKGFGKAKKEYMDSKMQTYLNKYRAGKNILR